MLTASGVVARRVGKRLRNHQDARAPGCARAFVAAVALTCVGQVAVTLAQLCGLAASAHLAPAQVALTHMGTLHSASALRWVRTQLPPRAVVLPEAMRSCIALLAALAYVANAQPGGLDARTAAALLLRACATVLAAPFAVAAFHERNITAKHLPPALLACPRALAPAVEGLTRAAARFADKLGTGPVLDAPGLSAVIACVATYAALDSSDVPRPMPFLVRRALAGLAAAAVATVAARRRAGNATRLLLVQQRLGVEASPGEEDYGAAAALARRLASASDEREAVRAALEELYRRFPAAAACAVATLPLPCAGGFVVDAGATQFLEAAAAREEDRRALLATLARPPPRSAARAVCTRRGPRIAASFDWAGVGAFTDWAAADAAGMAPGGTHVTLRLPGAGGVAAGFAVLVFEARASPPAGCAQLQSTLLAFASAVGAALCARRAKDALEQQARQLSASQRLVSHFFPAHVAQKLERLESRRSVVAILPPIAPQSPERDPRRSTPRVSFAADAVAYDPDDQSASSGDDCGVDGEGSGGGGDTLVTQHPCVTVVYADVVGFQALAAWLPAEESLRLLDALWQRFDALAVTHALFKVETSDDSYIAVAGMSPPRADHARAALRFALDLHAAAASASVPGREGAGLQLRVGLHTGAAASGVLGATRPRFALAGDAVAVARRAQGFEAGALHLSRAVADACGLPEGTLPERMRVGDELNWCALQAGSPEAAALRQTLNELPPPPPLTDSVHESGSDYASDVDARAWSETDEGGPARDGSVSPGGKKGTPQRSGFLTGRRSISPPPRSARTNASVRRSLGVDAAEQPGSVANLQTCTESGTAAAEEGNAAATEDDHMAVTEQRRLRTRAGRFMYAHLGASAVAPLGYLLACAVQAGGGRVGATAACVAVSAIVAGLHARRRGSEAVLYTPPVLTAALWTLAALNISSGALVIRAATASDTAARVRVARMAALDPVFAIQWIMSGVPVRLIWLPELLYGLAQAANVIADMPLPRSPAMVAAVLLQFLCFAVFKLMCLPLLYIPTDALVQLLAEVDTWPRRPAALRRARDACIGAVIRARGVWLGNLPLLGPHGSAVVALHVLVSMVRIAAQGASNGPVIVACIDAVRFSFWIVCIGGAVVTFRNGAASSLLRQHDDSESAVAALVLSALRNRIAVARSEAAILEAASEALKTLFPDAAAVAAATFAEGSGCALLASLEIAAPTRSARQALLAALPLAVGASSRSSVSRVCAGQPGSRPPLLDSRAFRGGVGGCVDWAAASDAGLPTARAITVPLTAGALVVGFVQLHFGLYSVHSSRPVDGTLARLCDSIGGAIFVRRAFAVNRDAAVRTVDAAPTPRRVPSLSRMSTIRMSSFRKNSLEGIDRNEIGAYDSSGCAPGEGDAPAYPANAEDAAMLAVLDASAEADRATLLNWALDPAVLSDSELQRLTAAMFHALGLMRAFSLSPVDLSNFIADVAAHMNDVPFHHFRHAFAVTHIAWLFLAESATLRTRLLTEADWLALLLSALCHDLEHPGTTNAYQVNTQSALAIRYNDASVLESHHSACGWAALQRARLLAPMPADDARALRRSMVAAILATDMSAHKTLLAGLETRLAATPDGLDGVRLSGDLDEVGSPLAAGSFSRDSDEDRQLLVSFLLHCADLCNPLLPPQLSRRIADDLGREFAAQAEREREAGMPITVMLASDDVAKAKLEIGFIDYVVRPLYATLARVSPGMGAYCLTRIDANRAAWAALAKSGAPSTPRKSP